MRKWLAMSRSLSRPTYQVLTKNSVSSFETFQNEKEYFEREQLELVNLIIENGKTDFDISAEIQRELINRLIETGKTDHDISANSEALTISEAHY